MLSRINKRTNAAGEGGFTLIELLVVVIIIGILAAIAIPMYLSQREKGWKAAVKSDLRNAAVAQESYFTDNASYTTVEANLELNGFNPSSDVTLAYPVGGAAGYTMTGSHTSFAACVITLDSASGEPVEGAGC